MRVISKGVALTDTLFIFINAGERVSAVRDFQRFTYVCGYKPRLSVPQYRSHVPKLFILKKLDLIFHSKFLLRNSIR